MRQGVANEDKHPTESEFSAVAFDNTPFEPSFEVSPYKKAQPALTTVSPNLTKEKGFSAGRVDTQKTQAPRALREKKEKKEKKASLEPLANTGIPCKPKGIAGTSFSALHQNTVVPKGACSSSSITQPGNDQNSTQLVQASQNANDDHVFLHTPYQQSPNAMVSHTSASVDKRASCITQEGLFRAKLGYKLHSTGLRKSAFKPRHAVSSVDYAKTPKSSKTVFGGLGSLSLFMQTRGSDGGYVTSLHDPSSLSLSTSTRSGQDESSGVPSFGPLDPGKTPSEPSRSPSPAFEMQEMVTRSAFDPPPMFFLSTALLTTHPAVIRDMEAWPQNPPKLIYRDYGGVYSDSRYHYDAEIILAPDSGIILTTPHELTQRYLPGHGPMDARLNGIEGLNSPLKEKIFCLIHRYVVLVVLICKPQTADLGRVSNSSFTREITSLARFCDVYGEWCTTLLIPIPNHSASIALWCFGMGRLRYELFPPGSIENVTEEESEYEVALRDVGINPFGARFILDNIRVGGFKQYPSSDPDPSPVPAEETVPSTSTDSRAFDVFINMEPLEQVMQYGSSLGNKQMDRVSEVIELMAHSSSDDNETNGEDIYGTQISFQ